jgi:hypothetical protein
MRTTAALLTILGLVLALGAGTSASARSAATALDPARFTTKIDNEWFPLVPGTTYVYTGIEGGAKARDVVSVTRATTILAGVRCRAVSDRLFRRGRLAERTTDWYAQDSSGTVWYFGEATAELDRKGRVTSTEGSWKAGVDGAKPGILMLAYPVVGRSYRQEFYKGQAEDYARVIAVLRSPLGGGAQTVLTEEWTPLEPDVLDHKLYARGIGNVVERTAKGGDDTLELTSLTTRG